MAIAWESFGNCIARSHGVHGKNEWLLIGSMGLVRRYDHSIVPSYWVRRGSVVIAYVLNVQVIYGSFPLICRVFDGYRFDASQPFACPSALPSCPKADMEFPCPGFQVLASYVHAMHLVRLSFALNNHAIIRSSSDDHEKSLSQCASANGFLSLPC